MIVVFLTGEKERVPKGVPSYGLCKDHKHGVEAGHGYGKILRPYLKSSIPKTSKSPQK